MTHSCVEYIFLNLETQNNEYFVSNCFLSIFYCLGMYYNVLEQVLCITYYLIKLGQILSKEILPDGMKSEGKYSKQFYLRDPDLWNKFCK